MIMKNENYHRASHCKYLVQYHIIWCPKFRCDGMDETLKKILSEVCDAYGYIIKALDVMPDHIHIFVDCPVTTAPCDVVRTLKSMSAIQLLKAYPELKRFYARCGKLWSNGYFISSVGHISEATVKKYIEEQKNDKPELKAYRRCSDRHVLVLETIEYIQVNQIKVMNSGIKVN